MENNKYDNRYLDKLHTDILKIMDEVDRVCKEYHLNYYLMCGSCLGAVRHKGFIPWDDDLDIAMPRKDFERFLELVSNINGSTLRDQFYLRWVTTEKYYNHAFAKVCLKSTSFQENYGRAALNSGIFVDVFPLDDCGPYSFMTEIKSRLVKAINNCFNYKGRGGSIFDKNPKIFFYKVIAKVFSNRILHKLDLAIIKPRINSNLNYQAFFITPYPIKKQLFPKEWHGEGKLISFEGRKYVCPSEPEKYLSLIYGDDYMKLPPESKRRSHYPIRVVFSDGEEMEFEETKNKVTYKDVLN